MSSVWFADISMESLPGPRPVRPTVSSRPSTACFRQQSARLVDMHALKPCARSCFSLPENLTSPRSTRMPAEPHYPLSFQKSHDLWVRPDRIVCDLDDVPDESLTTLLRQTSPDMAFDERHD